MKKIILASNSPRRAELLKMMELDFEVADKYSVNELFDPSLPPLEVPAFLAKLKSDAYNQPIADNEILLTADTVVILNNEIIGKPKNRQDALDMLLHLNGNTHTVATAITLRTATNQTTVTDTANVTFADLTTAQIEYYVDTFKPFDKAGAYGIQEWLGAIAIERIDGSFYTVMGLPTALLFRILNFQC